MAEKPKIAILGAGISGLTTAYYLKKKFPHVDVTIFEKQSTAGGKIITFAENGIVSELGPKGVRPKGKGRHFLQLVEELGLSNQLIGADKSAKYRYLYLDGQLERVPSRPMGLLNSKALNGALKAIWKDYRNKSGMVPESEESIYDFISRRFSVELAENLADPVFTGICGGDARKLSAKAVIPTWVQYEKEYGSVVKGILAEPKTVEIKQSFGPIEKFPLLTLKGGLYTLVDRLMLELFENVKMGQGAPALTELEKEFDHIISCIPAYSLAQLSDSALGKCLKTIKYAPMAAVVLNFKQKINPYKGFGYLVPSNQHQAILGCMFNDQIFPSLSNQKGSSFTVMMGGEKMKDFYRYDASYFIDTARKTLSEHLNVPSIADPDNENAFAPVCKLWKQAIPQFNIGYLEVKDEIKSLTANSKLIVSGNYMGGISLIDCIRQAKSVVNSLPLH